MSAVKRAYIPRGCHQQGRLQTGQWLPRRVITTRHEVDADGFPLTYATEPAPLDGAHAATSVGAEPDTQQRPGVVARFFGRLTAAQFWIGYGLALGVCIGAGLVHLFARVTA